MANSDKNIRITPNRDTTSLPRIAFTGSTNAPISLYVLDDNTLSFEGSSGQLFSVNNNLSSGYIFSINDISGIPSFRVHADGTVGLAEFSGNVGIGITNPSYKLHIAGQAYASGGFVGNLTGTATSATTAGSAGTSVSAGTAGTATNAGFAGAATTATSAGTAGTATNAGSAGSATTATNAGFAGAATTATNAGTAGTATNAGSAGTSVSAGTAGTATNAGSAGSATTATSAGTAGTATNAGSAGTSVTSGTSGSATTATSAGTAGTATNAGFAGAATTATNAGTAGTATNAGSAGTATNSANTNVVLDTTSTIYLTGSRSNASIGSTAVYVLSGVSALGNTITATTFSGNATTSTSAGTAGTATNAGSAGTSVSAGTAGTATNAGSAGTAVNAGSAGSATTATNAGSAGTAVNAGSAGSATTATSAGTAGTATNAGSAGTSVSAGTAGTATNAGSAGTATNSANTNVVLDTTSTIYLTGSRSNTSIGNTPRYVLSGVSALGNTLSASGVFITGFTASTSITTGALVVNGGVGISGRLNVGSATTITGFTGDIARFVKDAPASYAQVTIQNSFSHPIALTKLSLRDYADKEAYLLFYPSQAPSSLNNVLEIVSPGGIRLTAGSGSTSFHRFSGGNGVSILHDTVSTSSTSGAFTVSGGAGISKTSYFGETVFIQGTTASGSTTTGALVVTGGVGIGGSLNVFGTIDVANNIEVLSQKEVRFFNSANTFYTGLRAGSSLANVTFTLPIADGTANQVLFTNGSAALGWTSSIIGTASIASSAAQVNIDASTATRYLVGTILNTASGSTQLSTGSGITIGNNIITATTFSGNATTATSAGTAGTSTNAGSAGTSVTAGSAGTAVNAGSAGSATTATNAGSAGTATNAGSAGTATVAGSVTLTSDSTNASRFLTFASATSGSSNILVNSNLSYNPSVGQVLINSSTASTSVNTGALVVNGGVGISGKLVFNSAQFGTTGIASPPTMAFIGSTGNPINLRVLDDNTISFSGSQGQLFSISPILNTGWIFSVNDISGIPLIRANADATIAMAEFAGNVGIGLSQPLYKLHVAGDINASTGYTYRINGTRVLDSTTLGTGVVNSSLTSVGTLTSGTWNATTIGHQYGGTGYTTYAKGDLLVGTGSSLLKLGIGTSNQILRVDTSAATGLTWTDGYAATYGAFYSTTTQQVTAANTATLITFNGTYESNKVNRVGGGTTSRIQILTAGIFNVQFSAQINLVNGNNPRKGDVWFRVNGNDVPQSNTLMSINGKDFETVLALNFVSTFAANDYVELVMSSTDLDFSLNAKSGLTSPTRPDIPSIILSVTPVVETVALAGVADTGIFSINGLNQRVQYIAIGTTGNLPNIASDAFTHTINIPLAGTGITGTISPHAQTIAGDKTFSGNLSVTGNLTINGTTTTVNSTVSTIVDPVITIGTSTGGTVPNSADSKDRGIAFYYFSGTGKTGFFGWDQSASKYAFYTDASISGEIVTGTKATIFADLDGNAGSATTATSAGTAGTATNAGSAGTSVTAGSAGTAVNAGFAGAATTATSAGTAGTATNAGSAGTAVNAGSAGSATTATNAGFAGAATTATSAGTAGTATNAGSAGSATTATNAGSAGTATNAGSAGTSVTAGSAGTATNAGSAGTATVAGSVTITADSTNASRFLSFTSATSGSSNILANANLFYNPSAGQLVVNSSTASTSVNTGALVVNGGVGVSGRLVFNQAQIGTTGIATIPSMAFIGQTGNPIFLNVLEDNSLSFDGAQGQLFSITPVLNTGWIFSVNDISGIPLIRANADATISMAQFAGNVGIGLSNPSYKLHVVGDINASTGYTYRINGTKVLDAISLGTSVVSSSLTSVGTLTSGTWNASTIGLLYGGTGQVSYTDGQLLIGSSTGNSLIKSTLTAGSGILISNSTGSITISTTGAGITNINGVATSYQSLAVGSSGTDFVIVSTGSSHTFNIPDASASNRGLITTGTQTIAGTKTFSSTITGSITGSAGSATTATTAGAAGTAVNAGFAGAATTATSAGTAGTATNAGSAGTSVTAGSATTATNAGFAGAATTATNAGSAGTAVNAGSAGSATTATNAGTAGTSTSAGIAGTATNAGSAGTATNSANTNVVLDTTSTIYLTGSRSNASIGSTAVYVLSGVSALGNTVTATTFSGNATTATSAGTAGTATNAGSAGTSITAGSAGTAVNAGSAGSATTATSAGTAGTATNAGSAGSATTATNAGTAGTATNAGSAGTSVTAGSAGTAVNAGSAGSATTATNAGSAGTSVTAGSAATSTNSANTNIVLDTTSTIYLTGSRSNASIGSTAVYVLSGVSALGNTITATTFSGNATTATNAGSAGSATTATSAGTAGTATNAGSAGSATTATSAGTAGTATNAGSAGTATNAGSAGTAVNAGSAGSATTATNAGSAGTAVNAGSAGTATNAANTNVVLDTTSTIYLTGSTSNASIGNTPRYVLSGVSALGNTLSASGARITGSTASTTPTTGALTITGGVGIGGKLHVGSATTGFEAGYIASFVGNVAFGNATVSIQNLATLGNSKLSFKDNAGKEAYLQFYPSIMPFSFNNVLEIVSPGGISLTAGSGSSSFHRFNGGNGVSIFPTTVSTSSTSGALTVSGGAGISKTSYFGETVFIQGTTASGSTTTGALVVTGGVGIGGSLNVFGTIDVANNIEVLSQKEVRFFNSANTFYTGLRAGTSSANVTFTLPIADGTANQVLFTNGSAALGWTSSIIGVASIATSAAQVNIDASTATRYLVGTVLNTASGNTQLSTGSGITIGNNIITATTFAGNATTATSAGSAGTSVTAGSAGSATTATSAGTAGTATNAGSAGSATTATNAGSAGTSVTAGSAGTSVTAGSATTATNAGFAGAATTATSAGTAGTATNAGSAGTAVNAGSATTSTNSGRSEAIRTQTLTGTNYLALFNSDSASATQSLFVGSGISVTATSLVVPDDTRLGNNTNSSNTTSGALIVSGGAGITGNLHVGGNFVLTGDLTVNGTTTTVNSTVSNIVDPIITIGTAIGGTVPNSADSKDRGIAFYYFSGTGKTGFFGWDQSASKYALYTDASISGEVVTGTKAALFADLDGNAGSATTATSAGTAGTATNAGSAGTSVTAGSAGTAINSGSSGSATTATNAGFAGAATTATSAGTAGTATNAGSAGTSVTAGSATTATNAGSAGSATTATNAGTAGTATNAGSAGTSVTAGSAGTAVNAGSATTATSAGSAGTATNSANTNVVLDTTSTIYLTGSRSNVSIGNTPRYVLSGVSALGNTVTATTFSGNATTATSAGSAGTAVNAGFAGAATTATSAGTAGTATNAGSAGTSVTSGSSGSATTATSAGTAGTATNAGSAGTSVTAGSAGSATTATNAGTAGTATNAGSAGTATNSANTNVVLDTTSTIYLTGSRSNVSIGNTPRYVLSGVSALGNTITATTFSGNATTATSAGTAGTSTTSGSAGSATTATSAGTAGTATNAGSAGSATTATNAGSAGTSVTAGSAGTAVNAGSATTATNAGNAGSATTATSAGTAGTATNAGSAGTATNSANTNIVLDTTSTIYLTGSRSNASIGSTAVYVLSGVSALGNTITATTFSGNATTSTSAGIAGTATNAGSAGTSVTSGSSGSATTATSAGTAGTATNAGSAGTSVTAGSAGSATTATNAGFAGAATTATNAGNAGSATTATNAGTAGTATNAGSAGTAVNAGSATTATNAGSAGSATTATNAGSAGTSASAGTAGTATNAGSAGTATNSANTNVVLDTTSTIYLTGSRSNASIGSTPSYVLSGVSALGNTLSASGARITGSTASTSPTTGALTVAGGVGIGGTLNVGLGITLSNYGLQPYRIAAFAGSSSDGTIVSIQNKTADFVSMTSLELIDSAQNVARINFFDSASIFGNRLQIESPGSLIINTVDGLEFSGTVRVESLLGSTSPSTGPFTVLGGVGIGKTSYFGQSVFIQGSTASGSTTTGALVVTGGVGIGGSLWTNSASLSSISGVQFLNSRAQNGFTINASSSYTFNIQDGANNQRLNYHADSNRTEFTGNNATHEIRLIHQNNSSYTGFRANSSGTVTYTLPAGDGSNGQLLFTNGTGGLGWTTVAGGGVSGIISLNGLTAATQTFAVGTSGSDFNISSGTSTHTFNIPYAGAASTGLITTNAQTIAGTKTFSSQTIISDTTASTTTATGALLVFGGLGVSGQINAASLQTTGNAVISGNLTFNGVGVFGNATSDTINSLARYISDILPSTDNSYDLGNNALGWRNFKVSGVGTIANLQVSSVSSGAWAGTAISAVNGGTGQNTYAIGDILYASSSTTLTRLAAGTAGSVLASGGAGAAPSWVLASAGGGGAGTVAVGTSARMAYYPGTGSSVKDATGFEYSTSGTTNTVRVFGGSAIGNTFFIVNGIGTSQIRVGIGVTNPAYELEIEGEISATNKSFVINHPLKNNWKLRYGSLEGPENGVYVRGILKDEYVIETPDYWTGLVDPNSFTVTLTPIGKSDSILYVEKIEDYKVFVNDFNNNPINCFFTVWAERIDIPKLVVEYENGTIL